MITKYTGPWGRAQVQHLLKRTMFGAKKADIDYFLTRTMDQAVTELLTVSIGMTGPLKLWQNADLAPEPADVTVPTGSTWEGTPSPNVSVDFFRRGSYKGWWWNRMIHQPRSIQEKMVMFWKNHWSTATDTIFRSGFSLRQHRTMDTFSLGDFKEMAYQMSIDPAMLVYLNGQYNINTTPDENYARELQELFTLGVNSGYTEDDIKEAAKVLTGWKANRDTHEPWIQDFAHDTSNKTFSSFYNNTVIPGSTADVELRALIDMIFTKTEIVSKFIVRKLYRWFVFYDLNPTVEADVITPLAQLLVSSNWQIKPVMQALLTSDHFYQYTLKGAMIKSPLDFLTGMMRELLVDFVPGDIYESHRLYDKLVKDSAALGQGLGEPPDVAGWLAYYKAPFFYRSWIGSSTFVERNKYVDKMIDEGMLWSYHLCIINTIAVADTFSAPSNPNALIDDLIALLYSYPFPEALKTQVKQDILLSGQTNDAYWSNLWNSYKANPTDMMRKDLVESRLKTLFKYFMKRSEYQLM